MLEGPPAIGGELQRRRDAWSEPRRVGQLWRRRKTDAPSETPATSVVAPGRHVAEEPLRVASPPLCRGYATPACYKATSRPRGGMPASSSMIPTDGLRLNRACPAP